eukprot:2685144-Amphidinium_carterae.1
MHLSAKPWIRCTRAHPRSCVHKDSAITSVSAALCCDLGVNPEAGASVPAYGTRREPEQSTT